MKLTLRCLFWVAISFVAAFVGGVGTAIGLGPWYDGLNKPAWTPPNSIFGPVWTLLYTLMGISMGWMDFTSPQSGNFAQMKKLRKVFITQIILNAAWPLVFFGAGWLWGGVPIILGLGIVIIYWIRLGWDVKPWASALLFPYAAWIAFASSLNLAIAWLNR